MSMPWLRRWISTNQDILSNSGSLIGTTAVTSGLGFIYWWLAARLFPATAIGLASAAISAMMLLGLIGTLGLGPLLIGELSCHSREAGSLITTALLVVGIISGALGVVFAAVAPDLSATLGSLSQKYASAAVFALGVALTAMTLVFDQAVIGLLRGELQLWRNALFSVIKLVALWIAGVWFVDHSGLTIYVTWIAGILASLMILASVAMLRGVRLVYSPDPRLIRELGRIALEHHMLNLALQAPGLLLPIVVTILLSAATNASFYAAWMIAAFAFVVPGHLATVLYAVGMGDASMMPQKARTTLRLSLVFGFAASIALFLCADLVLRAFGAEYAKQAEWCLRILGLGIFPLIIKNHYVAIRRVRGQIGSTAAAMLLGALLELIFGALGATVGGLPGLSLGWVIAVCVEAVLAASVVYEMTTVINLPLRSPTHSLKAE